MHARNFGVFAEKIQLVALTFLAKKTLDTSHQIKERVGWPGLFILLTYMYFHDEE